MGLLQRHARVRTIPELKKAAEQRFWDGFSLAAGSEPRFNGAIYLLGYVAEMLLMIAWYGARGVQDHEEVDYHRRLASHQHAADYEKAYNRRKVNDHELMFWLFALERRRAAIGQPVDPAFLGETPRPPDCSALGRAAQVPLHTGNIRRNVAGVGLCRMAYGTSE